MRYGNEGDLVRVYDSYIKACVRNMSRDIEKARKSTDKQEVSFSELPEELVASFSVEDIEPLFYMFYADGYPIGVESDKLSIALTSLSQLKRDIILMYYYLDMTDKEIGEKLNQAPKTVQKIRSRTLAALKRHMEEL